MGEKKQEWEPELAESFLAEYNAARGQEIVRAMLNLGFHFRSSNPDIQTGNRVTVEGVADDGTKITIVFDKGENYLSPKQREQNRLEAEHRRKAKVRKYE